MTRSTCRERNWAKIHGPHDVDDELVDRIVVGDGRVFPSKYPDTDDAVPLIPGCPVQMTWNVWGDDGKPIILNGQFGKFLGWTLPDEGSKANITPIRTPDPRGAKKRRTTKKYRVINRLRMKGKARVDIDGTVHELGVIKVKTPTTNDRGITQLKSKKVFPLECAYYTRLHRLQGQSISGKLHIDFKGLGSFEPACVYVGLSRSRRLQNLSVSNLDSHRFAEIVTGSE